MGRIRREVQLEVPLVLRARARCRRRLVVRQRSHAPRNIPGGVGRPDGSGGAGEVVAVVD